VDQLQIHACCGLPGRPTHLAVPSKCRWAAGGLEIRRQRPPWTGSPASMSRGRDGWWRWTWMRAHARSRGTHAPSRSGRPRRFLEKVLRCRRRPCCRRHQGGGADPRQVGPQVEGVLGVHGDQHVGGVSGAHRADRQTSHRRAGPRRRPGSMAVITPAQASRGSPARISRAISACSSRARGPRRCAAEMTPSRRTRSGRSTASCSATDPPVLLPSRNTG
jgi:hypothetical protein